MTPPPIDVLARGEAAAVAEAAAWLRAGGIVAFPTETYYGLAVDPASEAAVQALFDLKGRPPGAPLPIVAASLDQVIERCGAIAGGTSRLALTFWPGPLSLLVDAPGWMVRSVHAGLGAVAVRVPAHGLARALAAAFGGPVTATSANRSGEPPAASAAALAPIAADARVLVLDGGATPGGAPSTIVDARGARAVCVRAGAVAWDRVLESLYDA